MFLSAVSEGDTVLLQLCVAELVPLLQLSETHPAPPAANGQSSSGRQSWGPCCSLSPQSSTCGLREGIASWGISTESYSDVWTSTYDATWRVFSCVFKFEEWKPKAKVRANVPKQTETYSAHQMPSCSLSPPPPRLWVKLSLHHPPTDRHVMDPESSPVSHPVQSSPLMTKAYLPQTLRSHWAAGKWNMSGD